MGNSWNLSKPEVMKSGPCGERIGNGNRRMLFRTPCFGSETRTAGGGEECSKSSRLGWIVRYMSVMRKRGHTPDGLERVSPAKSNGIGPPSGFEGEMRTHIPGEKTRQAQNWEISISSAGIPHLSPRFPQARVRSE